MSKFVQDMEPIAVPKHVKDDRDAPLEANVHSQFRGGVGRLQWLLMQGNLSLSFTVRDAGAAASKTFEDERLGFELSMIKQRLSRNETRFQWVEGATMPGDVTTKGRERGNVELLRKLLRTARYQIRATFEML